MALRGSRVDLDSLRHNAQQRRENIYSLGSFHPREYVSLSDRMRADDRCTRSLQHDIPLDDLHVAANVFTMRAGPSEEWYFASSSSQNPQLSGLATEVGYCIALSRARRIDIVGSQCNQLLREHSSSITDAVLSLPHKLQGSGYDLLDPALHRSQAHYRIVVLGAAIQQLRGKYPLAGLLKTIEGASIYPVMPSPDEPAFLALKRLLD